MTLMTMFLRNNSAVIVEAQHCPAGADHHLTKHQG
jgi:hypothetical protein